MSEPNMTFNQALQELNRVCNVWRAASMLQDALQVASNLEAEIKRLESYKTHLDSEAEQVEEMMRQRLDALTTQLTEAEAKNKEAMAACEAEARRIGDEHAERLTMMTKKSDELVAQLQQKEAATRSRLESSIASLEAEREKKQSLVAELNMQLGALRQRLGEE